MLLIEAKTGVGLLVKENKTKKKDTFHIELFVWASIALLLPVLQGIMGLVRYCTSLSVEEAHIKWKKKLQPTKKKKSGKNI